VIADIFREDQMRNQKNMMMGLSAVLPAAMVMTFSIGAAGSTPVGSNRIEQKVGLRETEIGEFQLVRARDARRGGDGLSTRNESRARLAEQGLRLARRNVIRLESRMEEQRARLNKAVEEARRASAVIERYREALNVEESWRESFYTRIEGDSMDKIASLRVEADMESDEADGAADEEVALGELLEEELSGMRARAKWEKAQAERNIAGLIARATDRVRKANSRLRLTQLQMERLEGRLSFARDILAEAEECIGDIEFEMGDGQIPTPITEKNESTISSLIFVRSSR